MRPRERFRSDGAGSFGDAELVALVLGTGAAGRPALEIAAALITRFGTLAGVATAQTAELEAVAGVGPARAVRLHAALEAGRRASTPVGDVTVAVTDPDAAYAHLGPPLRGLPYEELHALFLDRRRRVVARRLLTRGSDGFTVVDPRQVFRPAIGLGAAAVILAHNHPSGDPTPSAQDRDVTQRCAAAGRVLGVALLDHLVIGGDRYCSLAEQGALPLWEPTLPTWTA